jgi:hypothetical protein
MSQQSKRDLIAAVSIGLMFVGAFILPITALGLALIGAGGIAMLLLILIAVRNDQ